MRFQGVLVSFYCFILLNSCSKEPMVLNELASIEYDDQVTKIEFLGDYSAADAVQFLQIANSPDNLEVTNGFKLFRINYKTHNYDNSEVIVSGLVAIPKSNEVKGLVSWQHCTITDRGASISAPSTIEGLGTSAVFAGNGYILVAADYIGLGVSHEVHTFYHMESTTNAIIDLIKIGEKVMNGLEVSKRDYLFLAGFSQGGSATVATQRELEISNPTNLALKGSVSISGAYNLDEIGLPFSIKNNAVGYFGYAVNSYSSIYGGEINSVIQEPYASMIPTWFDGSKDDDFLAENLPETTSEFLQSSFIDDVVNNRLNWFRLGLQHNQTHDWQPQNELRLLFGSEDTKVSPEDAKSTYNTMSLNNGNVKLINLGPFSHEESVLYGIPKIQKWFNEIE